MRRVGDVAIPQPVIRRAWSTNVLNYLSKKPVIPPEKSAFDIVLALADALDKNSTVEAIGHVLHQAAKASLLPVAKEKLLATVRNRTGTPLGALKKELATYEMELAGGPKDEALSLAMAVIAKDFDKGAHVIRSADGVCWKYNSRFWEPTTDDVINNLLLSEAISSKIGDSSLSSLVGSAKRLFDYWLGGDNKTMGFNLDAPPVVNCHNGEVWIDKEGKPELRPHRPDSRLTSCLPIAYDPEATCPTFDSALLAIFSKASDPTDMVRHWNEVMGYGIQPLRDIACFWLLIGDGNNGKTKLLETLQRLVGSQAVFNTSIGNFSKDKFNVPGLHGKLLLVDDDITEGTHLADGLLKTISEAKDLSTRHAYGARTFKFRCLALPIMAGNHWPTTSDNSHGLRRRAQVIPFDRIFTKEDADKELFPTIWEKELPGILNRALEGLARLRARGDFAPPADCLLAAQEFMAHANPLVAFIEDMCCLDQSGHVFLHEFRDAMKKWAADQGLKKPVPEKTLKRQLLGLGYEVKMVNGYNRVNGLTLKI
jgi:putative DNA primase/helicase